MGQVRYTLGKICTKSDDMILILRTIVIEREETQLLRPGL